MLNEFIKRFDFSLLFLVVVLIVFSLVAQYSLSLSQQSRDFFLKHTFFVLLGIGCFFLFSIVDFRFWRKITWILYLFCLLLLILVLFIGKTYRGVQGWIGIGNFGFQVSELAKLVLILTLAKFWSGFKSTEIKKIIYSFFLCLGFIIPIYFQPDLGTGFILFIIWLGSIFLVVKKKRYIILLSIFLLIVGVVIWFYFLEPYQKSRILILFNPEVDKFGFGWQIRQSITAVGSGGLLGKGFSQGSQTYLRFLPAPGTDFIFASFSEEFGFLGASIVLISYFLLIFCLLKISAKSWDDFSFLFCLGVVIYFAFSLFINIGMNLGIAPIIGIPLPLMSYGGSSLLVTLIMLGMVEGILVHQPLRYNPDLQL